MLHKERERSLPAQKRILSKRQWRRRKRRVRIFRMSVMICVLMLIAIIGGKLINQVLEQSTNPLRRYTKEDLVLDGVQIRKGIKIKEMLLTPNEYSRPRTKLKRIKGIVVHYVGNPGSTAKNNRNYFEQLGSTHVTYASSHFIVGLKGEIIQCVPLGEIAYASNQRNVDTLSIETCHEDETGKFNEKTYQSLVKLIAYLCDMFELDSEDVIRHYDVTKKKCPLYYVEHEDAWKQLKADVKEELVILENSLKRVEEQKKK